MRFALFTCKKIDFPESFSKEGTETTTTRCRKNLIGQLCGALLICVSIVLAAGVGLADIPEIIGYVQADKDDTFFGSQIVPLGDQNGDGYADFMVWDNRKIAYIYLGGPTINSVPVLVFDSASTPMSNVGDINGDLISDFCIRGLHTADSSTWLYFGGNLLDPIPDGGLGTTANHPTGKVINSHDINLNGVPDLIAWGLDHRSLHLFELDSLYKGQPSLVFRPIVPVDSPAYIMGDGLAVGYFNGDTIPDLASNRRPAPSYMKKSEIWFYWGGPTLDTIPDFIVRRVGEFQYEHYEFGRTLVNIGDINGDNFDDVLAGPGVSSADSVTFIYFGGPGLDTIPDIVIPRHAYYSGAAGDVNQDGYSDWLTSYPLGSSSFDYVNVYYGGPGADSIEDIRINAFDVPIFMVQWGNDVVGLGDVNGDGVDDFAVSGVKFGDTGMVFVFAGPGQPTDVKPKPGGALPTSFMLHQNYPNPFNLSTTIPFDVARRESIEIDIFDILGRTVRRLLSQELSAGSYTVEWDGKNDAGQIVASGTYFYHLRNQATEQARKMTLVK